MRIAFLLSGAFAGASLVFPGRIPSTSGTDLPPTPFEVGRPFPDILLPAADGGEPQAISRFRGRKVLLHVFASW